MGILLKENVLLRMNLGGYEKMEFLEFSVDLIPLLLPSNL
jgi:hypothetical protein